MHQRVDDGLPDRFFRICPFLFTSRAVGKCGSNPGISPYKFDGLFNETIFNKTCTTKQSRHRSANR